MVKSRNLHACRECGQQMAQWAGRCPGCGAWGTIDRVAKAGLRDSAGSVELVAIGAAHGDEPRLPTGFAAVDRVLGGGMVRASVGLIAGEPGIGKSTLLLCIVANLCAAGYPCLLVSGEESHAQIAARVRRLGIPASKVRFAPGRELQQVLDTATSERPALLAVDSIQTIRDPDGPAMPGGPSQVRLCADALVGLAKAEGIAILMTGHVTKDGDLAGPRTLEHAVDVVLTFDGDPRSGLRVLSAGKNRFGAEGETAWFEMDSDGLREIDPTGLLVSSGGHAGAATAVPRSGRRALAVEVQALIGATDGSARRQVTGLDLRRFSLVAAVLERTVGLGIGRAELYGASSGGTRVDDPACDLAVAAALTSAATGVAPPKGTAFVGEVALTGQVRTAPAMGQRMAAAAAAGCTLVFVPEGTTEPGARTRIVRVREVADALGWAVGAVENRRARTGPARRADGADLR